jgi:hypothetical protein
VKVYALDWPQRHGPKVDAALDVYLPKVRCEHCGRTWGDGDYMYPALDFEFFQEREFHIDNIVDRPTFAALSKRIQIAYGSDILLIPGCSVGPLTGTAATTKLSDFELPTPLVSKRALTLLHERKLLLTTGKCEIRMRGKLITSHLAFQPEPALMISDESLKENGIDFCRVCNFYSLNPLIRRSRYYDFRLANWPLNEPLVVAVETGQVLASEEFIEAVKSLNLTGLKFAECGRFV